MKLTENHIQELYKFTRQHYVYHFDVQTELVDHLANDIEAVLIAQPKLSFEAARDVSFKKFGVFGFMTIVERKQFQMTKKYFRIIFRFAKEWFRLPKIIITLFLVLVLYRMQTLTNAYYMYISICVFVLFLETVVIIRNKRKANRQFKKTRKKWMFQEIILVSGITNSAFMIFYALFYLMPDNAKDFLLMGEFRRVFSAIFITAVLIIGYVTLFVIPRKVDVLLKETYPEYKLI